MTWVLLGVFEGEFTESVLETAFYAALAIAFVEYFYHIWLLKKTGRVTYNRD